MDDFIHVAELHSIALDRYFEEVVANDARFTRSINDGSVAQDLEASVERIVGDIMAKDSRLEMLVNKYDMKGGAVTRSPEQSTDEFVAFIEESLASFEDIHDVELLKTKINQLVDGTEFGEYTKEDQDHILFVFAIYVDSYTYWKDNIDKWLDITHAPRTRWPMSPAERELYRQAAQSKYANSDAFGAVWGGVTGAWGGPIGFAAGWLAGGIGGSIATALGL